MKPDREENIIQEKIRKLLGKPEQYSFPGAKRAEFISRLYKAREERKSILGFIPEIIPVRSMPAFATVAATVLILLLSYYLFIPLSPVVCNAKGTVKIYRAARNEWMMVTAPKLKLGKNDIIKTFKDGQADIAVPNAYEMRLKKNTEIRLAKLGPRISAHNATYVLNKGRAYTSYKKAKVRRRNFVINTPEATTLALGTNFMVEVLPSLNKTWVGVLDGMVKVTTRDVENILAREKITVYVEAGEKTSIYMGKAPTRPERLMENELLELEELYRIGTKPQVALLISTGKTRVRELLSIAPLYISAEKPGALPRKIEEISKTFSEAIKEGSKEKYAKNIKQFENLVNNYPNPKYDVQFLLFIAAYYEYLDEHEKAIETFERIIDDYPRSQLASIAQCAIGIIYEEKLNDPLKAKDAYEKVLSNYPRSSEIEEAEAGLKRLSQ